MDYTSNATGLEKATQPKKLESETIKVTGTIPKDLHEIFLDYVYSTGETQSEAIEASLRDFLNKHKGKIHERPEKLKNRPKRGRPRSI